MSIELSLFQIEAGIRDLYAMREEAREMMAANPDDPEPPIQIQVCEAAIRDYLRAEIKKVDGVADFLLMLDRLTHEPRVRKGVNERCEIDLEIDRLRARRDKLRETAKSAEEQVKFVMEEMPWREGKPKKLEGVRHSLTLKGNSGTQPVEITDPILVPEEYKRITVTMPINLWMERGCSAFAGCDVKTTACEVSKSAVAEALAKACERCDGQGIESIPAELRDERMSKPCESCGGTGTQGVPGARLAPRGQSIVIK